MELGIHERIVLLNILPVEGNIVTVRIVQKLRTDLGFTEAEIKDHDIRTEENQVKWNETGYTVDISIGEKATDIIKDAFLKLDKAAKIQPAFLETYDRFMGADGQAD
jgi:hypothetical protein